MRICMFLVPLALLGAAEAALAQWQVGPIYPPRGQGPYGYNDYTAPPNYYGNPNYDPFRFNAFSGRFDYAPIPYEPQRGGANFDPFRFNWFSGRWDYRPWPDQGDYRTADPGFDQWYNGR